ncbi:hypothetical protein PROFUN_13586 [Planoprotostelium fungivorum]|uniref:Uncharacterized protein n=1 Tax=Planoprotostelium fungivorum TaxID=1890364 RepID=A0A2P6N3J1_9EUKA|nr:hypothetical protein PROFUN_13586 [Planoprotostelium fungivorum]
MSLYNAIGGARYQFPPSSLSENKMPVVAVLRAKYDFQEPGAEGERIMLLKEGDIIFCLFKHESGWAKGRKLDTEEKGWFPIDYTEEIGKPGDMVDIPKSDERIKNEAQKDENFKKEKLKALPETEARRFNIIFEMFTTEKSYNNSLQKITNLYLQPIKDNESPVEPKYVPRIFANIEELSSVSTVFLGELNNATQNWEAGHTVGQFWAALIPKLDIYNSYMKNHHTTIVTINNLMERKQIAAWLQAKKEEAAGLDFLALLIMPVQRILRYKLLLEDLLKNTPDTHPDHEQLSVSLKNILDLAGNVNESIKAEENFKKLCSIQRSFVGNVKNIVTDERKFICEGPLYKVCRKSAKFRWVFLFSDALVYASYVVMTSRNAKTKKAGSGPIMNKESDSYPKYLFHRMISLSSTQIKDVEDTETQKNAFSVITTEEKSFTVFAETKQDKQMWMTHLEKLTSNSSLDAAAPVWAPDSSTKKCVLCQKSFNVVQRRHHCRYCGRVVCGSCSGQSINITHISSKAVRVCKECYCSLTDATSPNSRQVSQVRSSTMLTANSSASYANEAPKANPPQVTTAKE